ncbi:MAG: Dna2/Cas4 domain-containing protein [Dehalococcoidia bacterium]|nr:MAG: Dna2/Cas4 domain-containing protein [Dehalococcoidia bacterium]
MVRLSYSKITDYEMCPRKYWCTYVKGLRSEPNQYLIAGKEIHELLYNSTLQKDWKKYLLEHPSYDTYKVMIDNYIVYQDKIISVGGNPVPEMAEVKFHDEDLDFSMVIDRVDVFNDRVLLMDYKSDAKVDQDKHDKQLLIYSYFYNKNFPDKPVTHYAPFFIKKNKSIKAKELTDEKMNWAMDWVKKNKEEIESKSDEYKDFPATPGATCRWCGHYLSGVCRVGIKAVQEQMEAEVPKEFEGADVSLEQRKVE